MRRHLILLAWLGLCLWATLVVVTGGFTWAVAGFRISARSAARPLVLAAIVLSVDALLFGWAAINADVEWLLARLRLALGPLVAVTAVAIMILGWSFGTNTAGGSDPSGYVSQADLWLRHELRIAQPFVGNIPLPDADRAFAPLGYRPAAGDHVIVPTYPPGLPLLMAIAKHIAGPRGPYLIVPILGALTIWLCYLLGARVASPVTGAAAAIWLASSPVFLYQLMWPMSDIPAAAFWTAAILFALGPKKHAPLASGLTCAIAIAIRPNLAPLAALPFAYLIVTRGGWRSFALGVLPGFALVATVNARLYGSPLAFGYGQAESLYAWANAPINFRLYAGWLVETHTPLVLFALVGLALPPRRVNGLLAAFAIGVLFAYLFYAPFDAWWYLRFLLPALPALLILSASGMTWLLARRPRTLQAAVLTCALALTVRYQAGYAASHDVFTLADAERRYETVGAYLASTTPPNAIVICLQHSGSVRYYANRVTLRYDMLPPEWLDRAVALMRERGYRPYILLEDWEEPLFKKRFAGSAIGRLDWKPMAEFAKGVLVTLYEPPAAR